MTRSGISQPDDTVTYDPEADAYYAEHDWDRNASLSVTLVAALAEVSDSDPTDMDPLDSYVDPDALDDLFRPHPGIRRANVGRLELAVAGYRVTVYPDGEIVVRP
ncbi:HalOD1 output domain-containing protein [Halostella salina]|uniref:HalOD1 output domain-containing protein n=1 Tax=Halostella salina TaxID=1547897 RepID=UPI0013CEC39B|nr:HalOD1 output domain-containing protein [Halostella salina]